MAMLAARAICTALIARDNSKGGLACPCSAVMGHVSLVSILAWSTAQAKNPGSGETTVPAKSTAVLNYYQLSSYNCFPATTDLNHDTTMTCDVTSWCGAGRKIRSIALNVVNKLNRG